jgi:hypothetical protein
MRVPPPAAPPRNELMTVHPSASVSVFPVKKQFRVLYFRIYAVNLSFFLRYVYFLANVKNRIM